MLKMGLWRVLITIRDAKRRLRQVTLRVNDDAVSEPQHLDEFVQEYALTLDALLTGAIVDIDLVRSVALPVGLKTVPALGSDVEEGALFVWLAGNKGYPVRQRLPTFDETLMQPGTRFVDQSQPEVQAFILLTTNPIETPAEWSTYPVDSRNLYIGRLKSAEEDFNE